MAKSIITENTYGAIKMVKKGVESKILTKQEGQKLIGFIISRDVNSFALNKIKEYSARFFSQSRQVSVNRYTSHKLGINAQ